MTGNKSQYRNNGRDIVVFHNKNEIPYIAAPHLHSQYEIYYNIRGAKGFMVNGEFYKCGGHDLIVIPKIQTHKAIVKKNVEYERCIINIDEYTVELIEIMCHNKRVLSWLKGDDDNIPKMVVLSEKQHEEFIGLIEKYNELEKGGECLRILSDFINILYFLKNVFENPVQIEYMDDSDVSYTDRVMKQIEQNFRTASVADIAASIYANEDYINRVFKEETGMTVNQYLIMRKIAEAKKYLYLGRSVKEACVLSGFRNYANFVRTFKKYEGYLPKELEELSEPF